MNKHSTPTSLKLHQLRRFNAAANRLRRKLADGSFHQLRTRVRARMKARLRRYARALENGGLAWRNTAAGAALALALLAVEPVSAQTFVRATDADNPLSGFSFESETFPSAVDLDGDGDEDVVVGADDGRFGFLRNDGAGLFTNVTGTDNPLDGLSVTLYSAPTFVDLDGDGDQDLVAGEYYGGFAYFRNNGGQFTRITGAASPVNGLEIGSMQSSPAFVDLDGDGDQDLISGESNGEFTFYQNDNGNFVEPAGSANPFDGFDVGDESSPVFVDLDGDGDLDMIAGERDGGMFNFFRNDNGAFVEITGVDNPLDGLSVDQRSAPTFFDIDADGDLDLISGNNIGELILFENISALPVDLLAFTGRATNKTNDLAWSVANEENFSHYEVQRSENGAEDWTALGEIVSAAAGTASLGDGAPNVSLEKSYAWSDNTPPATAYYRLRSVDLDGTAKISGVVYLEREGTDRLTVYPNPTDGRLSVLLPTEKATTVALYDVSGRQLNSTEVSGNRYEQDLQLPAGTYLLVATSAGERWTRRVVVR